MMIYSNDPEKNPRVNSIDENWEHIYPLLVKGNGRAVRDYMEQFRFKDFAMFNALYWRIDDWLQGYAGRHPMDELEIKLGFEKEEVGEIRLRIALEGKTKYDKWRMFELPSVMNVLRVS